MTCVQNWLLPCCSVSSLWVRCSTLYNRSNTTSTLRWLINSFINWLINWLIRFSTTSISRWGAALWYCVSFIAAFTRVTDTACNCAELVFLADLCSVLWVQRWKVNLRGSINSTRYLCRLCIVFHRHGAVMSFKPRLHEASLTSHLVKLAASCKHSQSWLDELARRASSSSLLHCVNSALLTAACCHCKVWWWLLSTWPISCSC